MGDAFASIHCRLFYRYRGKYLHKLHPFLIAFLAVFGNKAVWIECSIGSSSWLMLGVIRER